MSEHTGIISSLSLLLVQTQAARWKAAALEQLNDAHLYLDIARSGYLFHGYSSGMRYQWINVYGIGIIKITLPIPGANAITSIVSVVHFA